MTFCTMIQIASINIHFLSVLPFSASHDNYSFCSILICWSFRNNFFFVKSYMLRSQFLLYDAVKYDNVGKLICTAAFNTLQIFNTKKWTEKRPKPPAC